MSSHTKSRLEVNFIRLLEETQAMASGSKQKNWTFNKFIEWLSEKIPEMEKSPNAPPDETLKHYKRQVDFLKSIVEAEKFEKALDSSAALQFIPHGPATTADQVVTQQIHQRTQAQMANRLRKELLDLADDASEIRSRKSPESLLNEVFQDQMKVEEQRRDKMVEDMIAMTREWKEQSQVANKIIKKDLEGIDKSCRIGDTNQSQLRVEANRLAEFNRRACNCWIWIMLLFICCFFISA